MLQSAVRNRTYRGYENKIQALRTSYLLHRAHVILVDDLPVPTYRDGTPEGFTILATAPVRWHPDDCEWYEHWEQGHTGAATMGIYKKSGTVFTAATTDWSHGLAGGDAVVERITHNVLQRLSGSQ